MTPRTIEPAEVPADISIGFRESSVRRRPCPPRERHPGSARVQLTNVDAGLWGRQEARRSLTETAFYPERSACSPDASCLRWLLVVLVGP